MDPNVVKKQDLTYNDYLKVPELLSLQHPQSEPPHHDELLFIIIHQAYELWFKLILHEMDTAAKKMASARVLEAHHFVDRSVQIMKLLVSQIHILETMRPVDFLQFRDRLMPASGFQSLQFRELEFFAGLKDDSYFRYFANRPEMLSALEKRKSEPDLGMIFAHMMAKLGYPVPVEHSAMMSASTREALTQALIPVYQHPQENLKLYLLCEALVDFDQYLGLWREHHVKVVERIIGFKRGTGGSSGVEYLQATTMKKAFPFLWDVRGQLQR